jgi:hypothetical protein
MSNAIWNIISLKAEQASAAMTIRHNRNMAKLEANIENDLDKIDYEAAKQAVLHVEKVNEWLTEGTEEQNKLREQRLEENLKKIKSVTKKYRSVEIEQ